MTMREQILEKVEKSFQKAENHFNLKLERPKHIAFKRNGTVGGHCHYTKKELMFQLDLAEHNQDNFLNVVVPHEVAHYVQRAIFGHHDNRGKRIMPHGKEWKFIMKRVFGLEPERCHSYDTSVTKTRTQKRFSWTCDCGQDFKLSTRMHNASLKNISSFRHSGRVCKKCRSYIVPLKNKQRA